MRNEKSHMFQGNQPPRKQFYISAIPFLLIFASLIPLAFFAIFLMLDIMAIRLMVNLSILKKEGVACEGEIIVWRDDGRSGWKPTIKFVDHFGNQHSFEGSSGYRWREYQDKSPEKFISVIYAESNPDLVFTCRERAHYNFLGPWVAAISSFVVIVFSAGSVGWVRYLWYEYERGLPKAVRKRRRKKRKRL